MAPTKRKRRTVPSVDRMLARQLREIRRVTGFSQQRLADVLGEKQSTIARMESGERAFTVSEVFRIAAALNCQPITLLSGGLTGDDVPVTKEHTLTHAQAYEWLVGIRHLDGADRIDLIRHAPKVELDEISRMYEQRVNRSWLQPLADLTMKREEEERRAEEEAQGGSDA